MRTCQEEYEHFASSHTTEKNVSPSSINSLVGAPGTPLRSMTGYPLSQSYVALLLVISCSVFKGTTAMPCPEVSDTQNSPPLLLVLTSSVPAFRDIHDIVGMG